MLISMPALQVLSVCLLYWYKGTNTTTCAHLYACAAAGSTPALQVLSFLSLLAQKFKN
jgi:hypothetical protein